MVVVEAEEKANELERADFRFRTFRRNDVPSRPTLLNRVILQIHKTATHSFRSKPAYSEAIMSAAVAVPEHKLTESPNSRSIEVFDWFITASTNPISNASECEALQASLGFPLPEMIFGNNFLTLEHRPSGWKYAFTTGAALKAVKNGELEEGDGGVKVGYADKWMESRYEIYIPEIASSDLLRTAEGLDPPRFFRCQRRFRQNHMIGHILRPTQATDRQTV